MKAKRTAALFLALVLSGCAGSIVLPVEETLTHDEIVSRLKTLFKDEVIMTSDLVFVAPSENRVSNTKTRLNYQHTTPQPTPALYTPAPSYDWTIVEIDTSRKGTVEISVKTYRRGNFIHDRQYETESQIVKRISTLKERANKSLQPTVPPSLRSGGTVG